MKYLLLFSVLLAAPAWAADRGYDALNNLPDWSGWWGSPPPGPGGKGPPPGARVQAPYLPAVKAALDKAAAEDNPALPGAYCQPFRFVGDNGTMTGFEFLFTPGRVTITNELGFVRRIFTDGRKFSADDPESTTGNAVGHWQGDTLLVQTTAMDHTAAYPNERVPGAPELGVGATESERIFLVVPDKLEIDSVLNAPAIFTKPFRTVNIYSRDRAYTPEDKSPCVKNDRLVDPVTGKQRFDLTPPADLPLPPG